MNGRRPLLALGLVCLALGASACGERAEPTGTIAPSYPVTVQSAGGARATLDRPPARVVALDPGSAELVVALGAGRTLVGVPSTVRLPRGVHARPVVGKTGRVDVQAVDRLRPDLIVAAPDTDASGVAQARQATGAALYVQPARSIEDVERAILDLGFLLGKPAEARRLTGSIKAKAASVEKRLRGTKRVSVFVDRGLLITASDRSFLGGLVTEARGDNVAGDYRGLGPFPAARLKRSDPDVYLATSDSGVTIAKLRRDPDTKGLTAVRRGRVRVVPVDLVTWPGPRAARALETVAAALHPDAFR